MACFVNFAVLGGEGRSHLKGKIHVFLYCSVFLCGKQTLESWNFNIYGPEKMLEIHMKNSEDQGKMFLKMEDTTGGHYGIVLETRKNKEGDLPLEEEDLGILFMEDKKGDLCSFKAVKKVHEVNRHKGKEQLL